MKIITLIFVLLACQNLWGEENDNFRKPLNIDSADEANKDYFKDSKHDEYKDFKLEVEVDEENSYDDYQRRPSNDEPELTPWPYSPDDSEE